MSNELNDIAYCMDTFKNMREELLKKTINKDPDIFIGLYNIRNKALFDTYLQRVKIQWLIEHSEKHRSLLNKKLATSTKDTYNNSIEVFSSIYREFLRENGRHFNRSDIAIELLEEMEVILSNIIDVSEKCDESFKRLEVTAAKNKAEYNKKIEELKG